MNSDYYEMLGINKYHEIYHSNMLSFLLDYTRNGEVGKIFANHFFAELMKLLPDSDKKSQNAINLLKEFGWQTHREFLNTDVLLYSPRGNACLVIENKILSGINSQNGTSQLVKYENQILAKWGKISLAKIFLKPGEDHSQKSESNFWISMNYDDINHCLDLTIQDLEKVNLTSKTIEYLKDYNSAITMFCSPEQGLFTKIKKTLDANGFLKFNFPEDNPWYYFTTTGLRQKYSNGSLRSYQKHHFFFAITQGSYYLAELYCYGSKEERDNWAIKLADSCDVFLRRHRLADSKEYDIFYQKMLLNEHDLNAFIDDAKKIERFLLSIE